MEKVSLFSMSGLPEAFGSALLLFSFILLIAPYFSGLNFGIFNIPPFSAATRKQLKLIGPVVFTLCVVAFLPIWSPATPHAEDPMQHSPGDDEASGETLSSEQQEIEPAQSDEETTLPSEPTPIVQTLTIEPGTGFIFSSQDVTLGTGVGRDIWWNRRELVPGERMYSLGNVSDVRHIHQIATGHLKFGAFEPSVDEGFAVEIRRGSEITYAVIQVLDVSDTITFEWLYPFKGQVTGVQQ